MSSPPLQDLPEFPYDFKALRELYRASEATRVSALLPEAQLDPATAGRVQALATSLITHARAAPHALFADFLQTFRLSTHEGRVLLTLAEALLRIPDAGSADKLVNDLLAQGDWGSRIHEGTTLVQWASRGLALGRRFVMDENLPDAWHRLLLKMGDAVFRRALAVGVQLMARQFVQGETMADALGAREANLRYSFDRLGEAAQTELEAAQYFAAYREAITALAGQDRDLGLLARDGISIKLSALHPRFELAHWEDLRQSLLPRLIELGEAAATAGIPLTLDAEEADRLELGLALWAEAAAEPALRAWGGLGLAVQAYQLRAPAVIDWLSVQAASLDIRIPVRLVKGAYWDSEIKRAQQAGLAQYPVYTRKQHTDLAYLACARRLLARPQAFYPQFATHNAHTLAWLHETAERLDAEFETQRLAGMGEAVHDSFRWQTGHPLRVYAPIGSFRTLLPYLVRRLLENGSSQSFVNQLADPDIDLAALTADPTLALAEAPPTPHPKIPLPGAIFAPRPNSSGFSMADTDSLEALRHKLLRFAGRHWQAGPLLLSPTRQDRVRLTLHNPADQEQVLGQVEQANLHDVHTAYTTAAAAFTTWSARPVQERADCLRRLAPLLAEHQAELIYLLMAEGGKTLPDALSEWRETWDFCQYYAAEAERLQAVATVLPAISGESNQLSLHGRGVFLCISPWNFPLAIFAGQLLAALATGNTVVAKPASQTPLLAWRFTRLAHEAGIPKDVLQLLPGPSRELGAALCEHPALAGVVFTGSTAVARDIAMRVAARQGPLLPLIAETGGLNAMVADSSALPEQLVSDVLTSAFNSAGQRCSALRILWLQEDIRDAVLTRLKGALDTWQVGNPLRLRTDVGPVIDAASRQQLEAYCATLADKALWQATAPLPPDASAGHYVAPRAFLLPLELLPEEEVFGPILHVCTWKSTELDQVIDRINASGYGLTLGVHSRIESTLHHVQARARVGNIYLNRNQIGAVVGCQPFGGEGLSGTGFKAGGPHYLLRFCTERSVTSNLAALGVNTSLLDIDT
jgi:RHH-type proline utilization regulon transcriptional repressor/proline dehydrogenase/delta 1-pyrroline-5-carboxylate dehydrogenase